MISRAVFFVVWRASRGEQDPGRVQRCEQIFGDGGLAALVGDLPLAQDHCLIVGDRGD